MSGQGIKTAHQSNGIKPAGNGGGCIEKGPFKDMKVNLGPLAALPDTTPRTSSVSSHCLSLFVFY
jgi:tyrosinase